MSRKEFIRELDYFLKYLLLKKELRNTKRFLKRKPKYVMEVIFDVMDCSSFKTNGILVKKV